MDAISVLKKTIEIVKPDIYIDLGDVGEWSAFSAWKYKRKKAPPLEFMIPDMEQEVKEVNVGMDWIDESLDKVNCKERYMKVIMTIGAIWLLKNIHIFHNINLPMLLVLKTGDILTILLENILR